MIKAFIFDFFGVICPDLYWYFLSNHVPDLDPKRNFFKELSIKHDTGEISKAEFIKKISENTGVNEEKVLNEMTQAAVVDKNLVEFIWMLKEKYKIGVLSNSSSYFIEKIIRENSLAGLYDSIVVSEKVGIVKPNPKIFEIALESLGVKKEEAVFIDDNESNTNPAEKLGIKSFVYTGLENLKKDLAERGL